MYSEETKAKLLALARRYNMLIICDDVYDLLDYTGKKPLPRLVHMDRDSCSDEFGNVVSNSSTSKIVAPGLRFGWIETATPCLAVNSVRKDVQSLVVHHLNYHLLLLKN